MSAWVDWLVTGAIVLAIAGLLGRYVKSKMAAENNPKPTVNSRGLRNLVGGRKGLRPWHAPALTPDPAIGVEPGGAGMPAGAQELIAALESQLDDSFARTVQDCLRHLSDYAYLGRSGLAGELLVDGATQIERGKAVHSALLQTIDSLRPAGPRSTGTQSVPREWHAYTILHEAYVEEVPNRDIMSKLYISEGTFNRRRRETVHAVARALLEVKHASLPALTGEGLAQPAPAARPLSRSQVSV